MTKDRGTYYITTPIYYPSANLHVGHTYCTVMADAMARFKRLQGYDVMFLTGTDEHGQKIQTIADAAGKSPQEYVDGIVAGVKELWAAMEISYDDFIRTTEERHKSRVQEIFRRLYDKGDIYRGVYEGWYCAPCESFWTDVQLVGGNCPDCGRPVERAKEDAYFFKLSEYADRLLALYEERPEFLEPETRRNEMTQFIKQGLDDLCISRSSFDWGVPVPIEEGQVIYVWLDALSNYITALGWPELGAGESEAAGAVEENSDKYRKYWPADVHLVGKEIVRFHSVIWPAMLMSLGEPLPKQIRGHGWLLLDGGKLSKSKLMEKNSGADGAAASRNIVDPVELIERYGVDALKYFLLREYTFGQDGQYQLDTLLHRMNSDLANDLGNLLSRTTGMNGKYFDGVIARPVSYSGSIAANPSGGVDGIPPGAPDVDRALITLALGVAVRVEGHMDRFEFNRALEAIWEFISRSNKYIDETEPWALAKDEGGRGRLGEVLYNLAESLRIVSVLIQPFLHWSSEKIREQLGLDPTDVEWGGARAFGLVGEYRTVKGDNLFPRIDIEKELAAIEAGE
ncbi:MAG: methionine--tRNA ligase [Clostridiales Family XIII bacterium]|jgi:methionyl-tRNA synthetase|nr:methionine--tRNA ligase [Clostridiales Family XIII bacterium]